MAISTDRPRLLLPGLLPPDPFRERYWVRPGGAAVISLEPDDRQTAEVTVLSHDGRNDPAAIGATADAPATVLRSRSATGGEEMIAALAARGLDPTQAAAARLFGEWSLPGSS